MFAWCTLCLSFHGRRYYYVFLCLVCVEYFMFLIRCAVFTFEYKVQRLTVCIVLLALLNSLELVNILCSLYLYSHNYANGR
jgi:hypothetical protein